MRATAIREWQRRAEVVVVGFGCAGAAAAIEASAGGAGVLVLERASGWGGASAISSGQIYLGGGTSLQQACGFADSPTEMHRFLEAVVGPGHDEDKLRSYCDGSVEHFDWLVACGVPFKAAFYDGGLPPGVADGGLMFSGGENAAPWDRIARPAPRSHTPCVLDPQGERKGGWALMSALVAEAARRGVEVEYDCHAQRLVVDDAGAVRGVVARRYGEEVAIHAARGVILTAGGFAFNDEMVRRHVPAIERCTRLGTDGDDGRSIRMAQAAGAAVKHMGASVSAYGVKSGALAPSILVNRSGPAVHQRGHLLRAGRPDRAAQAGWDLLPGPRRDDVRRDRRRQPPGPAPDRGGRDGGGVGGRGRASRAGRSSTRSTFYNHHAERGEDPLFGKQAAWLTPLRSPFAVIEMPIESMSVFTAGGLDTDVDGHVLDLDGRPIAWSLRGGAHDLGPRRVGLRQRPLTGRRDVLRSPGRGVSCTRRRSWALRATTIVDRLISTAPTAGDSVIPAQASAPAASGMASTL